MIEVDSYFTIISTIKLKERVIYTPAFPLVCATRLTIRGLTNIVGLPVPPVSLTQNITVPPSLTERIVSSILTSPPAKIIFMQIKMGYLIMRVPQI